MYMVWAKTKQKQKVPGIPGKIYTYFFLLKRVFRISFFGHGVLDDIYHAGLKATIPFAHLIGLPTLCI